MPYILLVAFPIAISVASFLLRKHTRLVIAVAVATLFAELVIAAQIPVDAPARMLGLTLTIDPLSQLFLFAFCTIAALAAVVSWRVPHGENFVPVTLLLIGFTAATLLLLQEPFVMALLLISASICAVLAIVDLPTGSPSLVGRVAIASGLKYLVLVVVAGVLIYLAYVLVGVYQPGDTPGRASPAHLILGLLAVGYGVRLAITPFHSWLIDLAEDAAPMVAVMVIAVVNITSFLALISTFQFFPVIVAENERGMFVMQGLALATALFGAVLALGQPNLRRTVGSLIVYNAGVALFGLMTVSSTGLTGALFEVLNQIVTVFMLFLSVALLERPDGRPSNVLRRDLLWRWPIAGAGLIGAALSLIGLPPFAGFASKRLIFEAAGQQGVVFLGLLVVASGIALLGLLRLVQQWLLGPTEDLPAEEQPILLGTTDLDRPAERTLEPEPRGMALLLGGLLGVILAVGLYPQPLIDTISNVIRGLTFIRALS